MPPPAISPESCCPKNKASSKSIHSPTLDLGRIINARQTKYLLVPATGMTNFLQRSLEFRGFELARYTELDRKIIRFDQKHVNTVDWCYFIQIFDTLFGLDHEKYAGCIIVCVFDNSIDRGRSKAEDG